MLLETILRWTSFYTCYFLGRELIFCACQKYTMEQEIVQLGLYDGNIVINLLPSLRINLFVSLDQWMNEYKSLKALSDAKPVQFSSVQSLSHVQLFATPWIAARQASLSITNSLSSLRLTSIESVMPSGHLILGHPLLLLPPTPPSIRVFSNESTLSMRWPKYWSFSLS